MTPGMYIRTEEIRAKNRAAARLGVPCEDDCACRKHRGQAGRRGRSCPIACDCGRHRRSTAHNARIGMSVALTAEAKRRAA